MKITYPENFSPNGSGLCLRGFIFVQWVTFENLNLFSWLFYFGIMNKLQNFVVLIYGSFDKNNVKYITITEINEIHS